MPNSHEDSLPTAVVTCGHLPCAQVVANPALKQAPNDKPSGSPSLQPSWASGEHQARGIPWLSICSNSNKMCARWIGMDWTRIARAGEEQLSARGPWGQPSLPLLQLDVQMAHGGVSSTPEGRKRGCASSSRGSNGRCTWCSSSH